MKTLDKDYARRKLETLLRDLERYNAGEFWREMSRIAHGATGEPHAEELERHNWEVIATLERIHFVYQSHADRAFALSAIGRILNQALHPRSTLAAPTSSGKKKTKHEG